MDKNEVRQNFLKSLRVAINNTSVYFRDHPVFIKSVEDLKLKIDSFFAMIGPLKITVKANSLIFGDEEMQGMRLYKEIVEFLHTRKVENIEIKEGISIDELINFLTKVSLSSKDILAQGGLAKILKKQNVVRIIIGDLDYSRLLEDEGEEYKDVWLYLLKTSLEKSDYEKIDILANKFQKLLKKLKLKDLTDDENVKDNIVKFLNYLKNTDKSKFVECSGDLVKSIIESPEATKEIDPSKLKVFLEGVSTDEFSDILLDEIQSSDKVDSLSFSLFAKLVDRQQHVDIASSIAEKIEQQDKLKNNPQLAKGVQALVSRPDVTGVTKVYGSKLASILKNSSLGQGQSFDRSSLGENFRFVLLELFNFESKQERLELIWECLIKELDQAFKDSRFDYIKKFIKIVGEKKKTNPALETFSHSVDEYLSGFIENAIMTGSVQLDSSITDILTSSSLGIGFYLDAIFKEENVSASTLGLFYKFFPESLDIFYENLTKKIGNVSFIKKIIDNLSGIKTDFSVGILKLIYLKSNKFMKAEALAIMNKLALFDEAFLFSVLELGEFIQRRQVLLILAKNPKTAKAAARFLLEINNLFGIKGRILKENLQLIDEVCLKEAKQYLFALTKYKFFWNKPIRDKARDILRKMQ